MFNLRCRGPSQSAGPLEADQFAQLVLGLVGVNLLVQPLDEGKVFVGRALHHLYRVVRVCHHLQQLVAVCPHVTEGKGG